MIRSPSTVTWRFVSVVTPYVRERRECRSEPTRNHVLLRTPTASAHVHSRSYGAEPHVLRGPGAERGQRLRELEQAENFSRSCAAR